MLPQSTHSPAFGNCFPSVALEAKHLQVLQFIEPATCLRDNVVDLSLSLVNAYPAAVLALPSVSDEHLLPQRVPLAAVVSALGGRGACNLRRASTFAACSRRDESLYATRHLLPIGLRNVLKLL